VNLKSYFSFPMIMMRFPKILCTQDVSRLLDLCRQSIIFESIDDLATCLRTIDNDPDVHILRIKNRLDPNYNSLTTAGYRDVELNMLISNQATVDLGINTHVCEMQLIHQPYAELKVIQHSSQIRPEIEQIILLAI
jgi:hypothetical protein